MKKAKNTKAVTASKAASTKVAAKKTSTNSNASSKKKKEEEKQIPFLEISQNELREAYLIYTSYAILKMSYGYCMENPILINWLHHIVILYESNSYLENGISEESFWDQVNSIFSIAEPIEYEGYINSILSDIMEYDKPSIESKKEMLKAVYVFQEVKNWITKLAFIKGIY